LYTLSRTSNYCIRYSFLQRLQCTKHHFIGFYDTLIRQYRPPSIDESGDFMIWHRHLNSSFIAREIYGSLFNIKRSPADARIEVDLMSAIRGCPIPPQPQPVGIGPTSVLGAVGSWLRVGTQKSITGEQLDTLCWCHFDPLLTRFHALSSDGSFVYSGWT
jgi:hypothetical protein